MSDWKRDDVVLSQRTGTVFEYLGVGPMGRPQWNQLSPFMGLVEGYDPAEPVLLARRVGEKRLPVLDLEGMTDRGEPRCYHMGGATWQGKCIDCGAVCAPNLDDVSASAQENPDHEPVDSLLPYFGPEDGAE